MNLQESEKDPINIGSVNYGAATLFYLRSFDEVNAKKEKLRKRLQFMGEYLSFFQFMTGRCLSISAGLFCLGFFLTGAPALVSLLSMRFFQPGPITYTGITFPTHSETNAAIRHYDTRLLWSALAFGVAVMLMTLLFFVASSTHDDIRGKKINIKKLLEALASVPELKADATAEAIDSAMNMLIDIKAKLAVNLSERVNNESSALVL